MQLTLFDIPLPLSLPAAALPYTQWLPVGASALFLFLLWLFKWRHDTLAAKYARWQTEAQAIEVATHNALYKLWPVRRRTRAERAAVARGEQNADAADAQLPYPFVSIVVPAGNNTKELEYLLPRLLRMQYDGKFEIVVADQLALDENHDAVSRLAYAARPVRYTRVPRSSRQIELHKLAITLGVKAAYGEWVIVISPHTVPENDEWLKHFAENLTPGIDFVEAYYNYYDDGSLKARRAIMERVRDFNLRLNAYEQGLVLGCSTANYAVRKTWFVQQGGFADSLTLPFGEETIFAYRHAVVERSTLLCSPDTKLTEYVPDGETLTLRRIFRAETFRQLLHLGRRHEARRGGNATPPRRHSLPAIWLWRHAWWYRLRNRLCALLTYLLAATLTGYAAWRGFTDAAAGVYDTAQLWPDLAMIFALLLSIILPLYTLRRTLRALHERKYGLYILAYDLMQPWRSLATGIRRRLRRRTFVRRNIS